jgi:probable F420-dependent oxidoreductase
MQFGLSMFITDETIAPVALGRAAEDAGFDALFVPEHTHIPASRESPWPGGDELPREYSHTLDPFVSLSAIAATTEHLRVGTGIALIVERDPIVLAHEAASLDHLSGGRFELGIGAGWNLEEMRNHGTDPATRFRVMRERVLAMREIWTREEASFHGEFVDFDRIWSWPKPVQRPHLPVLVGGTGPHVLDRVLEYGDAWAPNPGWPPMPDLPDRLEELRERSAAEGRGHIPVIIFGVSGEEGEVERYSELGVDACIFLLATTPEDQTHKDLARIAKVAGL